MWRAALLEVAPTVLQWRGDVNSPMEVVSRGIFFWASHACVKSSLMPKTLYQKFTQETWKAGRRLGAVL